MKQIFFTVGPTQLYPTVSNHLNLAIKNDIGSISHRGEKAAKIVANTTRALKRLLNIPQAYHIFFTGSSLESMERIIENCVNQDSYHLVFGEFSKKFASISTQLGKTPFIQEHPVGERITLSNLSIPGKTNLICLTQNETSTGMKIEPDVIHKMHSKYKNKLIAVDVVSSVPFVDLNFAKVDCAFFSVQKGFGLPAGLGVLVVSNRSLKKTKFLSERKINIGSYHNFLSLTEKEAINQTPETPNLLYIYLLGKVAEDLIRHGIKNIRHETLVKADLLYNYFDNHKSFKPFIKDKYARSETTIVIDVNNKSVKLREYLEKKGLIVSPGYTKFKKTHIRIANFPSHTIEITKRLIKTVELFRG